MIKKIIFPGNSGQPCVAQYGIAIYNSDHLRRADIVVVQTSKPYCTGNINLYYSDKGLNSILNRILANDLQGVRVEFVTFTIVLDLECRLEGLRLPIVLDLMDYKSMGNPCWTETLPARNIVGKIMQWMGKGNLRNTYHSTNVVGGCANFYTKFEERKPVERDEIQRLLALIGYASPRLRHRRRV